MVNIFSSFLLIVFLLLGSTSYAMKRSGDEAFGQGSSETVVSAGCNHFLELPEEIVRKIFSSGSPYTFSLISRGFYNAFCFNNHLADKPQERENWKNICLYNPGLIAENSTNCVRTYYLLLKEGNAGLLNQLLAADFERGKHTKRLVGYLHAPGAVDLSNTKEVLGAYPIVKHAAIVDKTPGEPLTCLKILDKHLGYLAKRGDECIGDLPLIQNVTTIVMANDVFALLKLNEDKKLTIQALWVAESVISKYGSPAFFEKLLELPLVKQVFSDPDVGAIEEASDDDSDDEPKTRIIDCLLSEVASNNRLDLVKLLLEHGADATNQFSFDDGFSASALEIALRARNYSLINILIKHDPQVLNKNLIVYNKVIGEEAWDEIEVSPLMYAVINKDLELVQKLIGTYKANPFEVDEDLGNILDVAKKMGHQEIAQFIEQARVSQQQQEICDWTESCFND